MTDRYHSQVVADIEAAEIGQTRAMRELLLDPANEQARARLQAIDQRIVELREEMAEIRIRVANQANAPSDRP